MPMNYARRSIAGLLRLPPSRLVYRLLAVAFPRQAAKRFLTRATRRHGIPEKITIDGSAAKAAAIKSYNAEHGHPYPPGEISQ
jgi:hypothetical protein